MRSSVRSGTGSRANVRAGSARPSSARPMPSYAMRQERPGAISPAESVASAAAAAGTKRKERDYESDVGVEETNINVVVRCRGRNEREVRENSAVVVSTEGVKGKLIELSMGANALSHKAYNFDGVFSPAADQSMVFDDTVKPILGEMLAGYNCTIFAYGQTGTGKTYTMSGDMTETLGMLSDEAGIIPRVLQQLFNRLDLDDTENCVKVSFIELYNEELRDLLSADETAKLKIYDDATRRGDKTGTVVQGMEEKHIKNAAEGIRVLQEGSLKRQVAATKCNDLSSRSHTVFTITAYIKKTNEQTGAEDLVSAGKLNLVDLAGSENIQRSGAENKRAAEAGLINKSLLTLGRVINALVDRGSHIPYRESKLTRLLQDSLGGRTKTCIIATISTAKSNLEETISTLDYAFRAKNIRNRPQLNAMLNKKTLLRDFTNEIERLKSELITTRQRNGVYLSNESYEEMTAQSESRRIVLEEQAAKVETLESNLRNKVQELFSLTTAFMGAKKEHEGTRAQLDETRGVLDQTEIVLAATRRTLAQETHLRAAHEQTEARLTAIGGELIDKLHRTVHDVGGLHAKNKRKSDLQSLNRAAWGASQAQVAEVTALVEQRVDEFSEDQREHIAGVSRRMEAFVGGELQRLAATQALLDDHFGGFEAARRTLLAEGQRSREDMDGALEEIRGVREGVKSRVGESLQAISRAAEKIAADVVDEMTSFHSQLHTSYSSLGKDLKSVFDDLLGHIATQRSESDMLRQQLQAATAASVSQSADVSSRMQEALEEERRRGAEERQTLLTQLTGLIGAQAEAQETRLARRTAELQRSIGNASGALEGAATQFSTGMDAWDEREARLLEEARQSRDQLKTRLKDDWTAADGRSVAIQGTAKTVHAETVRVVNEQVNDLDTQMEALDAAVTRARADNGNHHASHATSLTALSDAASQTHVSVAAQLRAAEDGMRSLGAASAAESSERRAGLGPLAEGVCGPLVELREGIAGAGLREYEPTGETPQRVLYRFPSALPRTEAREEILARMEEEEAAIAAAAAEVVKVESLAGDISMDGDDITADANANTTVVFADLDTTTAASPASSHQSTTTTDNAIAALEKNHTLPAGGLREVSPNLSATLGTTNLTTGNIAAAFDQRPSSAVEHAAVPLPPLFKRSGARAAMASGGARGGGPNKKQVVEGRENRPPVGLAQGGGRRKSPRLN